jgi:hypothetical protein
MARRRRRRRGQSVMGYFRQIFEQHPEWLKEKSNDLVLAQYRQDNKLAADAAVDSRIKQNLANTKSIMRKHSRTGGKARLQAAVAGLSGKRLESLEVLIDDCITLAKNLDREALHRVIDHLRTARNLVVWRLGQPSA